MIFFRKVDGESMAPALRSGQMLIGNSVSKPRIGDVVVAQYNDREIIKRVMKISNEQIWLEGDNKTHSTDSRNFGWISKSDILGVMKYSLPVAQDPPKVRTARAHMYGWVASVILIALALIHLFRIDTFVPELSLVFNGNRDLTLWVASLIVIMEVFALPFLLRMRLSPLAQYVSGAFAVLVPLTWSVIAIWTQNTGVSTAQLGEFVSLPSSMLLVIANIVWLAFSYYTVLMLGYGQISRGLEAPKK